MKKLTLIFLIIVGVFSVSAQAKETNVEDPYPEKLEIDKPLYKPFIERYILDELKLLRMQNSALRIELAEKVSTTKLDITDRALGYAADTTSNVFYIITIAASLLVLLGWRSLREVKDNVELITSEKLSKLTQEYEKRLDELEAKIKRRSDQIIQAQNNISDTNVKQSLWMRAGLEKSEQAKISIYDEILELNPDDIEALTYKADSLLELNEDQWSLSLSDQAIEINDSYALAYWQRACAKSKLGNTDEAMEDLKAAIDFEEHLKDEIQNEPYFENLKSHSEFKMLVEKGEGVSNAGIKK
jgi:tetratricopeptide (TPR) repeat protein